jgi:hypothetical protein
MPANVTVSPDMSLPIPTPSDPGPDYATNVNKCLEIIDGHTHTGAPTDGLQLDLAKQTVEGDVQLNDHNLGTVRSVELVSQPGNLTGTQDVNCIYVNEGVLGFNNASGTFIPLVGQLPATFFNWIVQAVSTNFTIPANATYNLLACTTTGGAITITLPAAATIVPTPQWRLFLIYDVGEDAGTHNIAIKTAGGDTFASYGGNEFDIESNGGYIALITDGVSKWYAWDQNTYNGGETLAFINSASWSMEAGTITTAGATIDDGSSAVTLSSTTIAGTVGVRSGNLIISGPGALALETAINLTAIGSLNILSGSTATVASGGALNVDGTETIQSGGALTTASGSTTTVNGAMTVNSVPDFTSDVDIGGQAVLAGGIRTSGATLSYNNPVAVNVAGGGGTNTTTLTSAQYEAPIIRITRTSPITGTWKFVFPNAPTVPDGTTWYVDLSSLTSADTGNVQLVVGSLELALVYQGSYIYKNLFIVQVNSAAIATVVG